MKNLIILLVTSVTLMFIACGGSETSSDQTSSTPSEKPAAPEADQGKGIGEIKNVTLNTPLKAGMVEKGKSIYEMKCAACHKNTEQRVVGPGFAKVTERRKPEWIMNMVTNVEVMLDEDPVARELLKQCLVKMPNQNLSIGDARDVLEYLYANDGYEVGE